jgi:hypothetical protein
MSMYRYTGTSKSGSPPPPPGGPDNLGSILALSFPPGDPVIPSGSLGGNLRQSVLGDCWRGWSREEPPFLNCSAVRTSSLDWRSSLYLSFPHYTEATVSKCTTIIIIIIIIIIITTYCYVQSSGFKGLYFTVQRWCLCTLHTPRSISPRRYGFPKNREQPAPQIVTMTQPLLHFNRLKHNVHEV